MHFVAPTIKDGVTIFQLDRDETDKESVKWQNSMILYVVGDSPPSAALDRFITSQWSFAMKPMFFHNDVYFVLKFDSATDRDEVLLSGPHLINSKPIIVKPWKADFNFNEEILKTIPLWVKFPDLPLNCWGVETLSRISSGLGNPLFANECTSSVERISYARVLVETDVTQVLPEKIKIARPNGKVFEQAISYE